MIFYFCNFVKQSCNTGKEKLFIVNLYDEYVATEYLFDWHDGSWKINCR